MCSEARAPTSQRGTTAGSLGKASPAPLIRSASSQSPAISLHASQSPAISLRSPAATLCLYAMLSAQAIDRRRDLDHAVSATGKLEAGAAAIASSSRLPCTVVEIDYELDTCTLEFESQGVKRVQSFTSIGSKPGGARLHRVIPTLQPGPRRKRGDEKAEKARPQVEELFKTEGATSPSMRDQVRATLLWPCNLMPTACNPTRKGDPATSCLQPATPLTQVRRRVGGGLYQTAQALVIYSKRAALFSLYCVRYPQNKISFSLFQKLAPW